MTQEAVFHLKDEELQTAVDETQDAIIVRDLEDRIVFWNRGAERLYGWRAHEVAGQNIYDVLSQKDPPFPEERGDSLARSGEWTGELLQVRNDGRDIVVRSRWKVLRDSAGLPKSVLISNRDITETKALQFQLLRAQRMETLGRLASGIGHDLSNALSPMLMATHALQRKHVDDETRQWLENLAIGAEYAASLTAQLLSFGKGTEEESISIQPGYLIKEFLPLLRSAFPKSIAIETAIPPDLWTVTGNVTNLHQVVMNLCMNARDAMPLGGTLTIGAENVVIDAGRYICIRVQDTGTGIPADIADKIMEPFFTTREPDNGAGLGLFVVLRIVNDHNGFIKVSSEVEKGARFEVYLPSEK